MYLYKVEDGNENTSKICITVVKIQGKGEKRASTTRAPRAIIAKANHIYPTYPQIIPFDSQLHILYKLSKTCATN